MKLNKQQLLLFVLCLCLVCAISCGATFGITYASLRDNVSDVNNQPNTNTNTNTNDTPSSDSTVSATLDKEVYDQIISMLRELSLYGLSEETPDLDHLLADSIVAATGDPYAAYFTAAEYLEYAGGLSGEFVGIGVAVDRYILDNFGDTIRILHPYANSPASAASLATGDLITHINDVSVAELEYQNAVNRIGGESGSSLTLTILRDGTSLKISVTRGSCIKETVFSRLYTFENATMQVGYVRITDFDTVTTNQFISAVSDLEEKGADHLIFDLRYNGGGYLRTVCEMLAYLLPDGDICTIDYHSDLYSDYIIRSSGDTLTIGANSYTTDSLDNPLEVAHKLSVPSSVLINSSTASAAELFTSALRDYSAVGDLDVTIYGQTSYGKGSMQSTYQLSDGSFLKLTIALYTPPCGINYDGIGITPDEIVFGSPSYAELFLLQDDYDPVLLAALEAIAP